MSTITTLTELAQHIDHTVLKAEVQRSVIETLCEEAAEHQFYAVCVNPVHVSLAVQRLRGSAVKVATVCGFPLGASTTATKVFEAQNAIHEGAHEVDMVLSIGALKDREDRLVQQEIAAIKNVCPRQVLKVILETALLSVEEIQRATTLAKNAGADYVKTSTGFSSHGATEDSVRLMRKHAGPHMGVKASGGIRNLEQALGMIRAGASRLGTSNSVAIMHEFRKQLGEL